jgi:hypothetical protein
MITVKGKICGVSIVGDNTPEEQELVNNAIQAVAQLETALTAVFDNRFSQAIIARLGTTEVQVGIGTIGEELNEALEASYQAGLINKKII